MPDKISYISDLHQYQFQSDANFEWPVIANHADRLLLGYFKETKLIGLLAFERKVDDFYNWIVDLEIKKDYQGRGYGSKLLATVMLDAFQQGFDGFVVLQTKTNGVERYYEHLGGIRYTFSRIRFETDSSRKIVYKYLHQEV